MNSERLGQISIALEEQVELIVLMCQRKRKFDVGPSMIELCSMPLQELVDKSIEAVESERKSGKSYLLQDHIMHTANILIRYGLR
jgi:hypothetical protein